MFEGRRCGSRRSGFCPTWVVRVDPVRPEVSKDERALGAGCHRRVVSARLPGLAPAGEFLSFASPKERNQRKGEPGAPPLRGSLCYSAPTGAAELGPEGPQTVLALFPLCPALLGGAQGKIGGRRNGRLVNTACTGCCSVGRTSIRRGRTGMHLVGLKPDLRAACGSPDAGVAVIRGKRALSFPDCAALHPGYKFFRVARRAVRSSAPAVGLEPDLRPRPAGQLPTKLRSAPKFPSAEPELAVSDWGRPGLLFEPQASLQVRPGRRRKIRVARRAEVAGRDSLVTFLPRSKKVTRPPGRVPAKRSVAETLGTARTNPPRAALQTAPALALQAGSRQANNDAACQPRQSKLRQVAP